MSYKTLVDIACWVYLTVTYIDETKSSHTMLNSFQTFLMAVLFSVSCGSFTRHEFPATEHNPMCTFAHECRNWCHQMFNPEVTDPFPMDRYILMCRYGRCGCIVLQRVKTRNPTLL